MTQGLGQNQLGLELIVISTGRNSVPRVGRKE